MLEQMDRLIDIRSLGDDQSAEVFARLGQLADQAGRLAREVDSATTRTALLRAQYGLVRRLDIWHQVHLLASRPAWAVETAPADPDTVIRQLDAATARLRQLRHFKQWHDFLLIGEARDVFSRPSASDLQRRRIAQEMLVRLGSPALTTQQRAYFRAALFQQLQESLRSWAVQPIDYPTLLRRLERYEDHGGAHLAAAVAEACGVLQWASAPSVRELGRRIDMHYRNANFRLAVSGKLLNRLLPAPRSFAEDVNDMISGAEVYGVSRTTNRLFLRLLPDPTRIRLGLEVYGLVTSDVQAYRGSVVFRNEGLSQFRARKLLVIDHRGLWTKRAEAEADSDTFVKGLQSEFDGIPIIGSIARSIALQQREDRADETKREVDQKLETKARRRLDRAVEVRLAKAEKDFQGRVLRPLQRLELYPEPISLRTTAERVIVRYRLAGFSQLAAYTPRPQAMSDSLLSVQLHQSVLNNAIERLGFEGGTFDLRDLASQLAELFGLQKTERLDELPEDVTIQFAREDAVRVDFVDGRVAVTVRIAMLASGHRRRWHNFAVRVHYVPETDSLDGWFVRDPEGYLELASPRLRLRDQIALRGIFSKVFSPSRAWSIIPDKVATDRRLDDLHVSQLVVRDGWIGLALAPRQGSKERAQLAGRPRPDLWGK